MLTFENTHIFPTKESRFALIISGIMFLLFVIIRIYKLFFSIMNFNFSILSLSGMAFILLCFFQDVLIFITLFFLVSFILGRLPPGMVFAGKIVTGIVYYAVFVYNIIDFLYFKSSTVSISWVNISQLENISSLLDSALVYMSPVLYILLVSSIFTIIVLPFILSNLLENRMTSIHIQDFSIPKKLLFLIVIILLFFTSQYFISCINSKVELNSNPLLKLVTSFAAEINSPKKSGNNDNVSAPQAMNNKLLISKNTPISITDRKTQGLIKNKLSGIKKRDFNVIYFLTESTYAGYYPMYGSKTNASPFLQEKSMNALLLKNMYSTGVRSINSLVTILTGLNGYPGYKSMTFINPDISALSLSEILKKRGYSNALIHGGSFDFYNKLLFLKNRNFDLLVDDSYFKKKYPDIFYSSWGVDDRVIVKEGLKWIDEQTAAGKNFFLTFVPIIPHHPYTLPPNSELLIKNPKSLFDNYLNSLYFVDRNIKVLFDGLGKRGILDDTVIVFLADHGEAFGQHPGNFGHENNIFEENVRIPGIIFNPRIFDKPYEFDGIATNADMFATILDILGLEKPAGCQGESVLKFNSGRIAFFASDEKNMDIGLRDGDYKAIYSMNENTFRLYDMKESDIDLDDLSQSQPELSREYKRLLSEYFVYQKNYLENFNEIIKQAADDTGKHKTVSLLDLKPYFESQDFFPVRKNVTADEGKPFIIRGKTYPSGYGVFANSCMKFSLKNAGFTKFKGMAGKIDTWSTRENYLEMQILVDGKKVFSTGLLNYGDDPVDYDVELPPGTETLELLVLDSGDNQSMDSAAWIDPVLY